MRMIHGRIDGPLVVSDELAVYGLAAAGITVRAGAVLHLFGVANGDVRVDEQGTALVAGVIGGSLFNEGHATVTGTVCGTVYTAPTGTTELRESARVRRGGRFRAIAAA